MPREDMIDTHVHFWDMRNPPDGLAWTWLDKDEDHPILGNIDAIKMLAYDVQGLWAEARFANVKAFVHVQAALGSKNPVAETEWLTRMREGAPVPFTIVGDVSLGNPDAIRQLDDHCRSPYFVGVRDFGCEPMLASGMTNPVYQASLTSLASRGLVFDLDCEWPHMVSARVLAMRHPTLTVVLEHIGYPRRRDDEYFAHWAAAMQELSAAPNVMCKISGLGMTDPRFSPASLRRWIETALDAFGPSRCMLGSNWPVDRLYSSYDVIMEIYRDALSELLGAEDQNKVLFSNAARTYRLT